MDVTTLLATFGLKDNLAKAYLAALKLGEASPHAIAKEANIERTTIYKLMEELATKGVVTKTANGKRLAYRAEHPALWQEIFDKQKTALAELVPLLIALQSSKSSRPKIKFYDDLNGMRRVLMDSVNTQEKLRRDFALVDNVTEVLGTRFIHNEIEERVKHKINVRSLRCKKEISPPSEKDWYLKGANQDLLRETRYLNVQFHFEPLIIIYDHIVTIISSKKEFYAIVIESPEFAGAMKILFDIAWESAKK